MTETHIKPILAYFDLRPGDALDIRERDIYIGLTRLDSDGTAVLELQCENHQGTCSLAEGRFLGLDGVIGIYNFGHRKRGRRMHVRVEIRAKSPPGIQVIRAGEVDADSGTAMLSLEELADRWRIARDTVYRWSVEGRIPNPVRIGDDLFFRKSDIVALEEWNTEDTR